MPAWSSSPLMLDHVTVRSVCPQPSITQPVVVHGEGSPSAVSTDTIGCNVYHHFDMSCRACALSQFPQPTYSLQSKSYLKILL